MGQGQFKRYINLRYWGWYILIQKTRAIIGLPNPEEELRLLEEKAKATYDVYIEKLDTKKKLEAENVVIAAEKEALLKQIDKEQGNMSQYHEKHAKLSAQKADLEKKAKDNYLGLEHEVSIIGKQNKTLYLITRLTWDDKAMKKDLNLIKGFVFNKTNNDVSVFETDPKKTNNKTIVSDLLWDYIGAGISQEWKKGKDWKM